MTRSPTSSSAVGNVLAPNDSDLEHVERVGAIVTDDETGNAESSTRVAWVLDEIDLANLAKGGTLWVTQLGGLAPHYLHVQPPHSRSLTDLDGADG